MILKTKIKRKRNAVRLNDNSIVTVMTNVSKICPVFTAKRYDGKEKITINAQQPSLIQDYNKNMGGVDLHDNGIANYRIRIKGEKWWWLLFSDAVNSG